VGTSDPRLLAASLLPGDVLLVEGSSRISSAIKYLTQSSWSHSTLCIATPDPDVDPEHEQNVLLEVDVSEGVRLVPLSKYSSQHTRICRPVGLTEEEINQVIRSSVARVARFIASSRATLAAVSNWRCTSACWSGARSRPIERACRPKSSRA